MESVWSPLYCHGNVKWNMLWNWWVMSITTIQSFSSIQKQSSEISHFSWFYIILCPSCEKCVRCVLLLNNWVLRVLLTNYDRHGHNFSLLKFTINKKKQMKIVSIYLIRHRIDGSMRSRPRLSVSKRWRPKLKWPSIRDQRKPRTRKTM